MIRLKNMKIGVRLGLGFVIILLLMCIMGIFAINRVQTISGLLENLYIHPLAVRSAALEANANIMAVSRAMKDVALSTDSQSLEAAVQTANDCDAKVMQNFATIKELFLGDQSMVDEALKAYQDWKPIRDEVIADTRAGDKTTAGMVTKTKGADQITLITNDMNDLINFTKGTSDNTYTTSIATASQAATLIIIILVIAILLAILIAFIITIGITKSLKKVMLFADAFGNGDLTAKISINSKDEVGILAQALNNSGQNVRELVSQIIGSAGEISAASEELSATTEEISSKMEAVNESVNQISKGTQELSSTTEEVSASSEEIGATTSELARKSEDANVSVKEIKNRATNIKDKAAKALEVGNAIYEKQHANILKAIEEGKVVEQVKVMADSIANIASQTNLLALNAAIEAARAGEQGKGFAVVADEVRKLAEQSSEAVTNIQSMVTQVQAAFDNLSQSGRDVLEYMLKNVQPSYKLLAETGIQYEKDSEFVDEIAANIASAAKQMSQTIEQVNSAIQNVSATAQESASSSEEIMASINETTVAISDVAKSAQNQASLAEKLNSMVQKFKI